MNVINGGNNILTNQLKAQTPQGKSLSGKQTSRSRDEFSSKLTDVKRKEHNSESSYTSKSNKNSESKNHYADRNSRKEHESRNERHDDSYRASSKRSDDGTEAAANSKAKKGKNLAQENSFLQNPTDHISANDRITLGKNSNSSNLNELNEKLDQLGFSSEEIVDPLTRRVAVQKFMKKMNDEFGVTPIDLVGAFSKLNVKELGLPPEQTAMKVVSNLDISSSQKPKAEAMFNSMLEQTEASSMAEYLKGAGARQISLEGLSKQQLQKSEVTDAVKQMQNSFFNSKQAVDSQSSGEQQAVNTGLAATAGKALGELQAKDLQLTAMQAESGAAPGVKSFDDLMGQLNLKMGELSNTVKNMDMSSTAPADSSAEASTISAAMLSTQGGEDQMQDGDEEAANNLTDEGFAATLQDNKAKSTFKVDTAQAAKLEMTDTDESKNSTEILKSAQKLIKSGGGEMKVKLNPAGMGEMSVKVSVEQGKVNIDLFTQSNDIKKIVERGLGDLKATLAGHNFDVQQIKVDVSQDLQTDLNQQEEDQQMAQQFLQDFRRQNDRSRDFMSGFSGGLPSSQTEGEISLQAEQMLAAKSRKGNPNRRLDLVA